MRSYWDEADKVLVHPGTCVRSRSCSDRRDELPGYMIVELLPEGPTQAFVLIDRRGAEWTATFALTVEDATGANGEACAEQ